ncbi:SWIM domain-containing protein [Cephalotus follicularis]|uniref:SWIM domain-containing protein n=1 Tax=Cephalotus follicularis TaxID=3775 RepID=A0A1Q3BJK2_CEPFO|nr:SWIM domain-containing protein [Cephalotus follicularis]
MENRHCSCQEWSISGIPCRDFVAYIPITRGNLEDLCDDYFSIKRYLKTYETPIHPLPKENLDIANDMKKLKPPTLRRLAGRPRGTRRRAPEEEGQRKISWIVKYTTCHKLGHNKKGCQRDGFSGDIPNQVSFKWITCFIILLNLFNN